MPVAVIMPKFEMAQETGTVTAWLKGEGEAVEKGEPLLEIETDKVTQEVEAPASGTLMGICAHPGEVVPIASPIAYIVRPGESWIAPGSATEAPKVVEQAAAAPGEDEVKVTPLAARMAQEHGLDLRTLAGTGPHGRITREDVEGALSATAPAVVGDGKVRAVPAARRLARELGVDLAGVRGSGPEGRIQSDDVRRAAAQVERTSTMPEPAAITTAVPQVTAPAASYQGPIAVRRVVPHTSMRRTIAERMTASVREAPQFNITTEADMGRALAIVEDLKQAGSDPAAPKVTLTALLVKACAFALAAHPIANSAFSDEGIVEFAEINVGVATAVEDGLLVPVVRGAEGLGLRGIAASLAELTKRAREGRLRLEDLQGGTFTLSNLGMFGITSFTAILNPPQAAILAVGRVVKRAVVGDDDQVTIRPLATLTLTADHRVLDGATAARFLGTVQQVLEHPGLLMQ